MRLDGVEEEAFFKSVLFLCFICDFDLQAVFKTTKYGYRVDNFLVLCYII